MYFEYLKNLTKSLIFDLLEKENIDWFAHCYQELAQHKIESKNNIMIVGLSYGGASLLRATLDKRTQSPKPKSVLSYGTYYSIDTALDFFITGIIKYNNIELITTGPISLSLGKESSGIRLIEVDGDNLSHQYINL